MSKNEKTDKKAWPADCIWPEPLKPMEGMNWDEDLIDIMTVDDTVQDLLDIKEYYDNLVQIGFLNEDYTLNPYFEIDDSDNEISESTQDGDETDYDAMETDDAWEPKIGEDYWLDDHFDETIWADDLSNTMNLLKITDLRPGKIYSNAPADEIQNIIGYEFINENLLRQAFTRRAFAIEQGIYPYTRYSDARHAGCSEELEFLGDSILNLIVTKEIMKHHSFVDSAFTPAPFHTNFDEGIFSKMRSQFTCKEHLSARASLLKLDQYILYGAGEQPSESAREDMMEALIGAVTVDSNWDMPVIEKLVDHLLQMQIDCPDSFLKKSYYDIFNQWHTRHFGTVPDYTVDGTDQHYYAIIRFMIPDNTENLNTCQIESGEGRTRSEARTSAAERAYFFVTKHGLWMNLKDANMTPDIDNSINQLQELYQKKYIEEKPVYEFQEDSANHWFCDCYAGSVHAYGKGQSKIKAKKRAAYMALVRMLESAGIFDKEWDAQVWKNIYDE